MKRQTPTFIFLAKLILHNPWLYLLTACLWVLVEVSPIVPGLILKRFFDILASDQSNGLYVLVFLTIAVALGRSMVIVLGLLSDIRFRYLSSNIIRRNILKGLFEHPNAAHVSATSGEAVNRYRDDIQQIEETVDFLLDTLGKTVFAVIAIVTMVKINVQLTLTAFLPLVAVMFIAYTAKNRITNLRAASRSSTQSVANLMNEVFSSVQAIKVASAESNIIQHLSKLGEIRKKAAVRDQLLTKILDSIFQNTVIIGTGLILVLAAEPIRQGTFSVGDFSLFVYYLGFISGFTEFFGSYLSRFRQTAVSIKHLNELLGGKTTGLELVNSENGIQRKIRGAEHEESVKLKAFEVKSLSYEYSNSSNGLDAISFSVPQNSLTVITGRNGSGKTTLLKCILGLLPVDMGTILWNGEVIEDSSLHFTPPRSSYIAQVPQFLSLSLKENIVLGAEDDEERLQQSINQAIFSQEVSSFPEQLQTLLGAGGMRLSGGQRQRAATARMFYRDADLYLIDDLSSALDVETEQDLWIHLKKRKQKSYLVVSNRRLVLEMADHIVVLKDGRVESIGDFDNLYKTSTEFRRLIIGE